jgi:DNA-binding NtrC family response regulator
VKPLDLREVGETIDQLLGARPSAPAAPSEPLPLLIGVAASMQRTFVEIAHACAGDAPVLITGQTGTGKTLAARVIHSNSARRDAPFVTLHCGSLPEPLLESELFGYEKNAFTGALSTKPGHIERATGGTLFLDEIADIPAAIQAKLLRFVEERTFTRIGGREDRNVDLRLITATNRNLVEEVRAGRFREDLYYRLHVLEIGLPPLSQRKEDIPALAAVFLGAIAPGRPLQFTPEALALLCRYPWPGNVRQLRNTLEHAAAVSSGDTIFPRHLPADIREHVPDSTQVASDLETAIENWLEAKLGPGADYDGLHAEIESLVIKNLLKRFDNKPTLLARALNMNRVTLRKKMGGGGVPQ